jgi:hypothetical protein
MQRAICCRIFTPAARSEYPAASLRDYCCGALSEPIRDRDGNHGDEGRVCAAAILVTMALPTVKAAPAARRFAVE